VVGLIQSQQSQAQSPVTVRLLGAGLLAPRAGRACGQNRDTARRAAAWAATSSRLSSRPGLGGHSRHQRGGRHMLCLTRRQLPPGLLPPRSRVARHHGAMPIRQPSPDTGAHAPRPNAHRGLHGRSARPARIAMKAPLRPAHCVSPHHDRARSPRATAQRPRNWHRRQVKHPLHHGHGWHPGARSRRGLSQAASAWFAQGLDGHRRRAKGVGASIVGACCWKWRSQGLQTPPVHVIRSVVPVRLPCRAGR